MTTAFTDLALAFLAVVFIALIYPRRNSFSVRAKPLVWILCLGCLALAGFLGFFAHGFEMSEQLKNVLWQPLYLSLGIAIAMFALAVLIDLQKKNPRPWVFPLFLGIAVLFYGIALLIPGSFLVSIAYEALAMLFAFVSYVYIAIRSGKSDAIWLAAGILLSIIAAVFQAVKSVSFTLIWTFDHNGIFHLVQMAGLVCLFKGIIEGTDA